MESTTQIRPIQTQMEIDNPTKQTHLTGETLIGIALRDQAQIPMMGLGHPLLLGQR